MRPGTKKKHPQKSINIQNCYFFRCIPSNLKHFCLKHFLFFVFIQILTSFVFHLFTYNDKQNSANCYSIRGKKNHIHFFSLPETKYNTLFVYLFRNNEKKNVKKMKNCLAVVRVSKLMERKIGFEKQKKNSWEFMFEAAVSCWLSMRL